MTDQLIKKLMLVALVAAVGCGSTPVRSQPWWPWRTTEASLAQGDDATPQRLPPGIELPPEPQPASETLPAGTLPVDSGSVIFASSSQ